MAKIQVNNSKKLKLTNACIYELQEDDLENIPVIVARMEDYIKSKGAMPVGPLVERTRVDVNESGVASARIELIIQSSTFVVKMEAPYSMEPVIRSNSCLFARYHGDENKLKFAYDKLNVIAFEEDIPITGVSYTVFTAPDGADFSADVFLEKSTKSV